MSIPWCLTNPDLISVPGHTDLVLKRLSRNRFGLRSFALYTAGRKLGTMTRINGHKWDVENGGLHHSRQSAIDEILRAAGLANGS